jgi:radical SAM protein with 4Fe4S-binding SPASM domain
LEELVAAAAGLGLRVNLITNACLLAGSERAAGLREAGLASAQVSLEGPDSDVHDELTGVDGSFEQTMAGLAAIREAGVHVHTNTTINAANVEHLDRLVQLVAEMGLRRMSMNMVVPTGAAANLRLQVCYEDIGAVVQRVRQAAIRCGVEFMWYSPTPLCLFNPLANGLGNKSCAACDGLLSISPNGDVLPCSSYAEPVGNLLRQPFDEVWQSARATFFRRKEFAPEECDGCESFRPCTGACPLYWSAMGTKELARASRQAHVVA